MSSIIASGLAVESHRALAAAPMSKLGRSLWWILGTAILAVLVVLGVHALDVHAILRAIAQAQSGCLLAASLAAIACGVGSALRLVSALQLFAPSLPSARVFASTLVTSAAQQILPSGAGEVVRTGYLVKSLGVPLRAAITGQLVDRGIDGVGVALLAVTAAVPPSLGVLFAVLTTAALALPKLRRYAPTLGWALMNEIVHAVSVLCVLRAAGLDPSFAVSVATVVGIRLAGLVPAMPGQLGVLESAFVIALRVQPDLAVAGAVLYRIAHGLALALAAMVVLTATRLSTSLARSTAR